MAGDYQWRRGQGEAAATGSGNSGAFSTRNVRSAALDINIRTITGGTTPNITFFVDRLGGDEAWYQVYATAALTATGVTSVSFSEDNPTAAQAFVLTDQARVRWVFGGGVPATSITFNGSFYGKE